MFNSVPKLLMGGCDRRLCTWQHLENFETCEMESESWETCIIILQVKWLRRSRSWRRGLLAEILWYKENKKPCKDPLTSILLRTGSIHIYESAKLFSSISKLLSLSMNADIYTEQWRLSEQITLTCVYVCIYLSLSGVQVCVCARQ